MYELTKAADALRLLCETGGGEREGEVKVELRLNYGGVTWTKSFGASGIVSTESVESSLNGLITSLQQTAEYLKRNE